MKKAVFQATSPRQSLLGFARTVRSGDRIPLPGRRTGLLAARCVWRGRAAVNTFLSHDRLCRLPVHHGAQLTLTAVSASAAPEYI